MTPLLRDLSTGLLIFAFASLMVSGCAAQARNESQRIDDPRSSTDDGGHSGGGDSGDHEFIDQRGDADPDRTRVPDSITQLREGGDATAAARDDRARLERVTRALTRDLEAFGGSVRDGRPANPNASPQPLTCSQTCSLASNICDSRGAICQIATRHPGEDEMRKDCAWASEECEGAEMLCERCQQRR